MMHLTLLWLPIVVSAVAVFFVSAASHMLIPYRQTEWSPAPDQAALQGAFREAKPGLYVFPSPDSPRERRTPEAMKRWEQGPSAFLTLVPPGPMSMGRNLALSFLMNLLVAAGAALLVGHIAGAAPRHRLIFHCVGLIGFLAYAVGPLYDAIWYWRPWKSLAMYALDALLYGAAMGAVFVWLWPR